MDVRACGVMVGRLAPRGCARAAVVALAVMAAGCSSASASGVGSYPGDDASADGAFDATAAGDDGSWVGPHPEGGGGSPSDAAEGGPNCTGDGGPATFTCTSRMSVARDVPGGTTLPDRRVLVAGGWNPADGVLKSAEIYDPATGTFTPTGSMASGHLWAGWGAPWPLVGGKALVAGGLDSSGSVTAVAELFDPAAGAFAATGSLALGAISMAPVVLDDGSVIFIGGWNAVSPQTSTELPGWSYAGSGTSWVQRYSPDAGVFTRTGVLAETRLFGCNVRVPADAGPPAGAIAIAGAQGPATVESNIERYDLEAGTWASVGNLAAGYFCARAFVLPNGKILLTGTGGVSNTTAPVPGMLVFELANFATTTTMNALANFSPNLVQLATGDVLAFGGSLSGAPTAKAQVYSWATNTWTTVGTMTQARSGAVGAYLLASGDVLIAGGSDEGGLPLATAEIYHP